MTIQEWDALLARMHGHLNNFAEKLVAVTSRCIENAFPAGHPAVRDLQPQLKRAIWDQKDRCAGKLTLTVCDKAGIAPADLPSYARNPKQSSERSRVH